VLLDSFDCSLIQEYCTDKRSQFCGHHMCCGKNRERNPGIINNKRTIFGGEEAVIRLGERPTVSEFGARKPVLLDSDATEA
jgi:hypothetical protein